VPGTVNPQKAVHPVDAEPRAFVAVRRGPDRAIGLRREVVPAAVIAVVVDEEEMRDAAIAVVFQEIAQPRPFVAERRETQDVIGPDGIRPVRHGHQGPPLPPRANEVFLALEAQCIALHRLHSWPFCSIPRRSQCRGNLLEMILPTGPLLGPLCRSVQIARNSCSYGFHPRIDVPGVKVNGIIAQTLLE
jgi:hypothetical protein